MKSKKKITAGVVGQQRHYRPRKPHPPKVVPPEKKKSPNSLRRVFNAIRNTAAEGGELAHPEFLERLAAAWVDARKTADKRYGIVEPTNQIFRATERGSTPLFYWQMENYGQLLSIPSGVYLIISRLTETKPHVLDPPGSVEIKHNESKEIAAGTRALLCTFEEKIASKDVIDDKDIRLLLDAYIEGAKAVSKS